MLRVEREVNKGRRLRPARPYGGITPRRLLILFVIPTFSLLSGCAKEKESESTPVAHVEVAKPKAEEFGEWTGLVGTTQPVPSNSALLTSPVEGRVLEILPEARRGKPAEGKWLEPDQTVVQLDARIARANRDKAAAALEDLSAQQQQAQIAVDQAQLEVNRLDELSKPPATSPKGSVPLVSPVEKARADLNLKDAMSKKDAAVAKVKAATADLKTIDRKR